eukprot:2379500-Rhodomonas_salina.1
MHCQKAHVLQKTTWMPESLMCSDGKCATKVNMQQHRHWSLTLPAEQMSHALHTDGIASESQLHAVLHKVNCIADVTCAAARLMHG